MANEILIPMDVTIVVYIALSTNMQVLLLCVRTLAAMQLQTETLSNNVIVDYTYSTNISEKNSFILPFRQRGSINVTIRRSLYRRDAMHHVLLQQ